MLKKLFSSTIRADVLALLLNSPDEKFYVREVARLLKKNPSGVKRELDNLEKIGIVSSQRVANLKYFKANKRSNLYIDLKRLVMKSMGLTGSLTSILRAAGAKTAFIYGPYARGEKTDVVDLFTVGASETLKKALSDLETDFGVKINVSFVQEADFNLRRKKEDQELKDILTGKRIALIGRV
ncbi:MAG: winged helix-turn-helix transcriptional regulator [Nitrospirota bacterium]|nr:MAG: winged helix-turn-helix transcriptional regulator [Nitrospirota bacterium]